MMRIEKESKNDSILYISYDGLLDPLGKSQIFPYIKGLSHEGIKYVVLSFEKGLYSSNHNEISKLKEALDSSGIIWRRLKYHKKPSGLATLYDVFYGVLTACFFIKRYDIKILHARSYVASLIAVILKKIYKLKFIFDMRGFWADERIEASLWKKGSLFYKLSKYFEQVFLQNADVIVSLTQAAKDEIESYPYLEHKKLDIIVIPTCVDLNRFGPHQDEKSALRQAMRGRFVVVYSGSISTWFMPEQMIDFFRIIIKNVPRAYLLVLTREKELFTNILTTYGLREDSILVESIDYESVPHYLSLGHVGLAFYRPGYSRKGCCPTKVGEYLACGLPVIINRGIGDTEEILTKEHVGIIINEFSNADYECVTQALEELLSEPGVKNRCRRVAEEYFSLNSGIASYLEIYHRLLKV